MGFHTKPWMAVGSKRGWRLTCAVRFTGISLPAAHVVTGRLGLRVVTLESVSVTSPTVPPGHTPVFLMRCSSSRMACDCSYLGSAMTHVHVS